MLTARTLQVLLLGDAALGESRTAKALATRHIRATAIQDLNDALERLQGDVFDAVVLDPSIHADSGVDTIMALRAGRPALPILVVQDEDASELSILHAGADGALAADADAEELEQEIQYAIERRREAVSSLRGESRRISEAMVTRFLRTVANHMYAPMTPILLQLPHLKAMAKTEEDHQRVDRLHHHLQTLDATIHRVVEAANFLQGLPPPLLRPTSLKEITDLATRAAQTNSDRIRIDVADIWLTADPGMTAQALAMLIDFAGEGHEEPVVVRGDDTGIHIEAPNVDLAGCADLFPEMRIPTNNAPMALYKARQLLLAQDHDLRCLPGSSISIVFE